MRKVQGPLWFRAVGVVFSVACVVVPTIWLVDRVLARWAWRVLQGPADTWWVLARDLVIGSVAISLTAGACALVVLRVRDWAIHIGLRRVLRGSGRCVGCSYSLVGLPVPDSFEVACPECGRVCRVHHALQVLIVEPRKGDAERRQGFSEASEPTVSERVIGTNGLVVEPPSLLWSAFFGRTGLRVWASVLGVLVLAVAAFFGTVEGLTYYYGTVVAPIAANPSAEWKGVRDALVADAGYVEASWGDDAWVKVESELWDQLASKPELRLEERYGSLSRWLATRIGVDDESPSEAEVREAADAERLLEAIAEIDAVGHIRSALASPVGETDDAEVEVLGAGSPDDGEIPRRAMESRVHFQRSYFWQSVIGAIGRRAVMRRDFATAADCVECLCALANAKVGFVGGQAIFDRWSTLRTASRLLERAIKAQPDESGLRALERSWSCRPRTGAVIRASWEAGIASMRNWIAAAYSSPRMARLAAFEALGVPEWLRYLTPAPGPFGGVTAENPVVLLADLESLRAAIRAVPVSDDLRNQAVPLPAVASKRLVALFLGANGVRDLHAKEDREDLLARTLLAIGRWRLERGAYPRSVSELVPSHLSELPRLRHSGTRIELVQVEPSGDSTNAPFVLGDVLDDTAPTPSQPDE